MVLVQVTAHSEAAERSQPTAAGPLPDAAAADSAVAQLPAQTATAQPQASGGAVTSMPPAARPHSSLQAAAAAQQERPAFSTPQSAGPGARRQAAAAGAGQGQRPAATPASMEDAAALASSAQPTGYTLATAKVHAKVSALNCLSRRLVQRGALPLRFGC